MLRRAVDDLPVAKAIVDGAQAQSPAGLSDSITARLGVSPVFTFAHDGRQREDPVVAHAQARCCAHALGACSRAGGHAGVDVAVAGAA